MFHDAGAHHSVNGVIHYNCPTVYRAITHSDVRLVFKDGKIVEATSSDTKALLQRGVLIRMRGRGTWGNLRLGLTRIARSR